MGAGLRAIASAAGPCWTGEAGGAAIGAAGGGGCAEVGVVAAAVAETSFSSVTASAGTSTSGTDGSASAAVTSFAEAALGCAGIGAAGAGAAGGAAAGGDAAAGVAAAGAVTSRFSAFSGATMGGGGTGRGMSFMISRSDGVARDCTRSRARARTSSAIGTSRAGAGARAVCSARIAPSKFRPCACKISAAILRASPTIAASTIAPLMSRLRLPRAAAAAASRMRRTSCDTPSPPRVAVGFCAPRRTCSVMSARSRSMLMWLASRTAIASGSSHNAASRCSRVTSPAPVASANLEPRASVVPRSGDIGI